MDHQNVNIFENLVIPMKSLGIFVLESLRTQIYRFQFWKFEQQLLILTF